MKIGFRLGLAVVLMTAPVGGVARAATNASGAKVNFSFEQAELRLLVRLVGEMTGRRFVMDESLAGKVTVVTPGCGLQPTSVKRKDISETRMRMMPPRKMFFGGQPQRGWGEVTYCGTES